MFNKQQAKTEPASISAEDIEATEQVVARVRRWGMTTPAMLLLAVGKPLGYLGAQMLYFGSPMLHLLDSATGAHLSPRANTLARLLENPATLEHLTARLEQAEERPRQ